METLIDGNLTETQAHENFCLYYDIVVAKRYIMTEVEFNDYKNSVLSKTNSSNIHNITGILGCIYGYIYLSYDKPEKSILCLDMITQCKSKIYKLLNS